MKKIMIPSNRRDLEFHFIHTRTRVYIYKFQIDHEGNRKLMDEREFTTNPDTGALSNYMQKQGL